MKAQYSFDHSAQIDRQLELELDHLRLIDSSTVWRSVGAIAGNWAIIVAAFAVAFASNHHALAVVAAWALVGARQHGLLILMHDASHYNLAPSRALNNWLSDLFCAWPHLVTTASYRLDHLQHHREVNHPERDPNMRAKVGHAEWQFPMSAGKLTWIFAKDLSYGGAWRIINTVFNYFRNSRKRVARGETQVAVESRRNQLLRLAYYLVLAAVFAALKLPPLLLLYWFVPMLTVLPLLLRLRILSEHHGLPMKAGEAPDDYNQSRDYARGAWQRLFLAPHFVAHHLAHHLYPSVPWYRLPQLHSALMGQAPYASAVAAGGGQSVFSQVTFHKSQSHLS